MVRAILAHFDLSRSRVQKRTSRIFNEAQKLPPSATLPIVNPRSDEYTPLINCPTDPEPHSATVSPPTPPLPLLQPLNFLWGPISGQDAFDAINSIYEEAIHWKPNLFLVPFGSAGTSFGNEMARLFQAFADGSCLERISMKAITLLQVLLLQKPSKKSKTKDHVNHLKRRLVLWNNGQFTELADEVRSIQKRLISNLGNGLNKVDSHIFKSLMAQGKVKSALRYLSHNDNCGVLGLDDTIPGSDGLTTRDVLHNKHPPASPASPESLIAEPDPPQNINPIVYCNLDSACILNAALHTHGASGLSGLDAFAWRRLCSSFKSASEDLCSALAATGRRICTKSTSP